MSAQQDSTLSANLSPLGAWAFSIGASLGWGSLVITSNTYLAKAGPAGSVLGMLLGALAMLVIAQNYAYLMRCYPECGGAYSYAKEVFGYDFGFLTSWFLALTYLAMLWANMTSLPLFSRYFLGPLFMVGRLYTVFGYEVYCGEVALCLGALALTAALCIWNKQLAAHLMVALALLFSAAIAIVSVGSLLLHDQSLSPAYVPDASALSQIMRIAVISPWAFIGFENISHASEEFSFNRAKIGRVLVLSVVSTLALYVFVILLSASAHPARYASWMDYIADLPNLSGIEALPPFYAASRHLGGFGVNLLMLALMALVVTSLIGNTTALSRLLLALGKDRILPSSFATLNAAGTPAHAIVAIAAVSAIMPFLGRTAIGWIVDVTTIGATIIYFIVSASARRLALSRDDVRESRNGTLGIVVMLGFALYLLVPNLVVSSSMEKETYFLFVIWSILGFLFFRRALHRDKTHRFGTSIIVWVALLSLVLLVALIWMHQSMIDMDARMEESIHAYYAQTVGASPQRQLDEQFMIRQVDELTASNTRTILMTTGMFAFALFIMVTNYSYMSTRTKESETLAYRDPMTGVKSKHAYLTWENDQNVLLGEGASTPFALVVCDVNGLKYVNDTYGHKAGDDLIRSASAMVCELFKHSPVFRVGGDEFVVVLTGHDFEEREAILAELHQRSVDHIGTGQVVLAAGSSEFASGQDATVHDVFERADARMYEEKRRLRDMGARMR